MSSDKNKGQLIINFDDGDGIKSSNKTLNNVQNVKSQTKESEFKIFAENKIKNAEDLEKDDLSESDLAVVLEMCKELPIKFGYEYQLQVNAVKDYLRKVEHRYKDFLKKFDAKTYKIASHHNQKIFYGYNVVYTFLMSFVRNIQRNYKLYKAEKSEIYDSRKPDLDDFEKFRNYVLSDTDNKYLIDIKNKIRNRYIKICGEGIGDAYLIKKNTQISNFDEIRTKIWTLRERIGQRKAYFEHMTKDMQKYGFRNLDMFNAEFKMFLKVVDVQMPPEMLDSQRFSAGDIKVLDGFLSQCFLIFNSKLPYKLSGIKFKKIKNIFVGKFFSLYLPEEKNYNSFVGKANKALVDRDYEGAKIFFVKATGIKPGENYSKQKIKEIDEILEQKNQ